jgi:hypothetical protein
MQLRKRGLAFGLALFFLSSCSYCKTFSFPNDADDRPPCRRVYQLTLPDNTVVPLPEQFSLKEFLCLSDNTFCFPDDNTSLYRSQQRGGIELWRI